MSGVACLTAWGSSTDHRPMTASDGNPGIRGGRRTVQGPFEPWIDRCQGIQCAATGNLSSTLRHFSIPSRPSFSPFSAPVSLLVDQDYLCLANGTKVKRSHQPLLKDFFRVTNPSSGMSVSSHACSSCLNSSALRSSALFPRFSVVRSVRGTPLPCIPLHQRNPP